MCASWSLMSLSWRLLLATCWSRRLSPACVIGVSTVLKVCANLDLLIELSLALTADGLVAQAASNAVWSNVSLSVSMSGLVVEPVLGILTSRLLRLDLEIVWCSLFSRDDSVGSP